MAKKNVPDGLNDVNYRTVHLKLSDDELKEIDAWKKSHGIRTRSEAIRQMILRSIKPNEIDAAPALEGILTKIIREQIEVILKEKP